MKPASFFLAAVAATGVSAQFLQFGSGQLPACAQGCAQLKQAQNGCLPSVSDNPTGCFCQSAYLAPLKTNANAVCSDACPSATDQQLVQTWYINYCQNGGSTAFKANGGQPTAAPTAATSPAAAPAATTAAAAGSNGNSGSSTGSAGSDTGNYVDTTGKSWWDLHGRWIIMVIILVIGFAIIIGVGIWWKRRYEAKRDRTNGALPTAWGPSQHQHPASYAGADDSQEKAGAVARPAQSRNTSDRSSEPEEPMRNFSRPGKRLSKIVGRN